MDAKTREPVSEAACAVVLIAAMAAALLDEFIDGAPSRYLSYALLAAATPAAVAVLFSSIRRGAHSWSWVVVATATVAATLADMLLDRWP
ncbi:hypothetical protein [Actinomadura decatromicini]|uniref:Uncharacterized protein n=1 Tax=Actinomadura decatromicini TaxID=2604572 RepID=A0A5D3G0J0_9ACTN|nr:hypothetical protein [Actinomadura decatromicini]TYK53005.1 hypothetical protein FXF68_04485 [Actinomadura decatromicini]